MTNVVVLVGRLARPAQLRTLPSGDSLVEYQLTVPAVEGRRAESVPVVWEKAPASAAELDTDAQVVVVGRVRRRFFRAGARPAGRTRSATTSVRLAVAPAARKKRRRTRPTTTTSSPSSNARPAAGAPGQTTGTDSVGRPSSPGTVTS